MRVCSQGALIRISLPLLVPCNGKAFILSCNRSYKDTVPYILPVKAGKGKRGGYNIVVKWFSQIQVSLKFYTRYDSTKFLSDAVLK